MQENAGACLPAWQCFGTGNLPGLRFMGGSLFRMWVCRVSSYSSECRDSFMGLPALPAVDTCLRQM